MSEWKQATVGEIATGFLSGGTPDTSQPGFWDGDIPWITSKWLGKSLEITDGEKLISQYAVSRSATKVVPKVSIIFATRVGVGKVGINRIDLAINQDLAGVLIDNDEHDIKFLAYQLGIDSIQQYIAMNKRGATIKESTRDCLAQIRLNLPPLGEQREISTNLSTVQRAIQSQEHIIQTTTELKQALMQKLFSEGLRGEPQKETEIGLVPESWDVKRFDSFAVLQRGFDITKKDQRGGKHPVVSSGGVSSYHIEARVKGPGVVIGHKASLGSVHYIPSDYWPHDITLWVKDFKGNDLQFAAYLLETIKLKRLDTGAANPTLNRNIVHGEKIPIPPTDQQGDSGKAIKAVEEKIRVHENHKHSLQHLLSTLLHVLVTAKMRVFSIKCRMIC